MPRDNALMTVARQCSGSFPPGGAMPMNRASALVSSSDLTTGTVPPVPNKDWAVFPASVESRTAAMWFCLYRNKLIAVFARNGVENPSVSRIIRRYCFSSDALSSAASTISQTLKMLCRIWGGTIKSSKSPSIRTNDVSNRTCTDDCRSRHDRRIASPLGHAA